MGGGDSTAGVRAIRWAMGEVSDGGGRKFSCPGGLYLVSSGMKKHGRRSETRNRCGYSSGWSGMFWTRREENGGKGGQSDLRHGALPQAHAGHSVFSGAPWSVFERGNLASGGWGRRAGALDFERTGTTAATAQCPAQCPAKVRLRVRIGGAVAGIPSSSRPLSSLGLLLTSLTRQGRSTRTKVSLCLS